MISGRAVEMAVCRTKKRRKERMSVREELRQESKEAGRGYSGERTHQIQSGEQAGETERDEDQPELERLVKVHALPLPGPSPCSVHSVPMSMPDSPGGRAVFTAFSLVKLGKESRILPRVDNQVALGRSPM